MAFFLDCCRGATFSHVRGGADFVAGRTLWFVRRRSPQDALWDAVARHRRRPGLPQLQLRSRLYLPVSARVQMPRPAISSFQRPAGPCSLAESFRFGPCSWPSVCSSAPPR